MPFYKPAKILKSLFRTGKRIIWSTFWACFTVLIIGVVALLNHSHGGWGAFETCKARMCDCWRVSSECEKVRIAHEPKTSPILGEVSIWENLAYMISCEKATIMKPMYILSAFREASVKSLN